MGLDSFEKARRTISRARSLKEAAPERQDPYTLDTETVEPMKLPDIMDDPEKQALFGVLIKERAPDQAFIDEFWRKYNANEPWTPQERNFLKTELHDFSEKLKLGETAAATIDPEKVDLLAATNEAFGEYAEQLSTDRATELVKSRLKYLAMRDPRQVERLIRANDLLTKRKETEEYKHLTHRYEHIKNDFKLSDEEAAHVLKFDDPEERIAAAYAIYKNRQSAFTEKLNWLSGLRVKIVVPQVTIRTGTVDPNASFARQVYQSLSGIQTWVQSRGSIQLKRGSTVMGRKAEHVASALEETMAGRAFRRAEAMQEEIAETLAIATTGDDEFMKVVRNESLRKKPVNTSALESITGAEPYEAKRDSLSNDKITDEFRKQRDHIASTLYPGRSWSQLDTPAEWDRVREEFVKRQEKKNEMKGEGIFAQMMRSFLKYLFAGIRSKKDELLPRDPRPPRQRKKNRGNQNNQNRQR